MTADAEQSMAEAVITSDFVRSALDEACPGTRIAGIRQLDAGYTSRQWVADTDEGPLLVKTPVRDTDPEHLRRLIATTRPGVVRPIRSAVFAEILPVHTCAGDLLAHLLDGEELVGRPGDPHCR